MAWAGWEALKLMLGNILRLPPGTYVRDEGAANRPTESFLENPVVEAIVDITADDVAYTEKPFYLAKYDDNILPDVLERLEPILSEFNNVVGSIARDMLSIGLSIYKPEIISQRYRLIPIIDPVSIYLMKDMSILIINEKTHEPIRNCITFLHYTKRDLNADALGFPDTYQVFAKVTPRPMQLATTGRTSQDLLTAERSILRYRALLSRIVRFVSVDVGASQGDKITRVVNSISAGINADSMSLTPAVNEGTNVFEDNIPIIPHRGGVGKPDLVTDIPSADINKLADLDNLYNQLYLETRFPKSYADFSTALGQTAVSLIRGDIRYARLVKRCRSLIEETVNEYLNTNRTLKKYHVAFKLNELPTPEDDDILQSLTVGVNAANQLYEAVLGTTQDRETALFKLNQIESILAAASQLPAIKSFIQMTKDFIDRKYSVDEEVPGDEGFEGGEDFEGGGFEDEGFEGGEEPVEEIETTVDFPEVE